MKKLSENRLWDIYKKSSGLEQRKEDKQSPFFGPDIEYKFYEEDGRKHFRYEEIYDILKKNPDWRLPKFSDLNKISSLKYNKYSCCIFNQTATDDYVIVQSKYGELKVDFDKNYKSPCPRDYTTSIFIWVDKHQFLYMHRYFNTTYIHDEDETRSDDHFCILLMRKKI